MLEITIEQVITIGVIVFLVLTEIIYRILRYWRDRRLLDPVSFAYYTALMRMIKIALVNDVGNLNFSGKIDLLRDIDRTSKDLITRYKSKESE